MTVGSMTPTGAQVTVTYTPTAAAPSPEPAAPPAAIPVSSTPVVSGVAQVGRTLVASTGAWSPGTVLTWQWQADGVPIPGATAAPLHAGRRAARRPARCAGDRDEAGQRADVAGVGADGAGHRGPAPAGEAVDRRHAPRRRILTARPGTWPAGVRLSYRWLADGKAVKGGTGKRLAVTGALVGTRVSVRVTARLPGYRAATARSARTGEVSG